ncbi:putative quinol monooxygenase [Gordonia terrae]|uniref:putative quinol monooxygenase n=1 Tax=Gordonia terrae TaxID=2055 RepID=UPI003F6B3F6C
MVIVAGRLEVDAQGRTAYLDECAEVVSAARRTPGCLDFAICADPVDPNRINIFERWASQAAVDAFRGEGVGEAQSAAILSAVVAEYDVSDVRVLAGEPD